MLEAINQGLGYVDGEAPNPEELAAASRPARMTLSRGGQPTLQASPAPIDALEPQPNDRVRRALRATADTLAPAVKTVKAIASGYPVAETAANLATGAVAMPVAGLTGLAAAAAKALGYDVEPGSVVEKTAHALTYQPKTDLGEHLTRSTLYPLEKLAEGGRAVGERVQDAGAGPGAATAAETAIVGAMPLVVPSLLRGRRPSAQPLERREPTLNEAPRADTRGAAPESPAARTSEVMDAEAPPALADAKQRIAARRPSAAEPKGRGSDFLDADEVSGATGERVAAGTAERAAAKQPSEPRQAVEGELPLPSYGAAEARRVAVEEAAASGEPRRVIAHPTEPGRFAVLPAAEAEGFAMRSPAERAGERSAESTSAAAAAGEPLERPATGIALNPPYTGAAAAVEPTNVKAARPDAIRDSIRELFNVPINEGGIKRPGALGIYKVKPQTIRVRNQNDVGVITHELGHHLSEISKPIREARLEFDAELRGITPYAAKQKSAALQREEGMAEFVRFYLTDPAQAAAKAPGFFVAFDDYVAAHGFKPALQTIGSSIWDWMRLPPAERILAKVGEAEPPFRKRWNVDRVVFETLDRWLPMKRMVEDLKPGVAPSADPFKLAHLLAGDAAIIENWLLRETTPFSFERRADVRDRGKPLSEILKPLETQAEQRQFGAYLIAKRASALTVRGKEHLFSPDEIRAGLTLETPKFKAAAEELYRYQDQLLDYATEGGLLSSRAAEAFRQFPFYVPFFRVGEPIARQGGNLFKEIRGGTDNLRDPIANIMENTVRVVHATNRNFVLAKAHDLARQVPGGGRWLEDVPMPERAVKLETQKVIEALRKQGVEISQEAAEALATSQTFFVKNPFGDDANRIVIVRRDGKPHALQVNNDMLWRALERFEPVDMAFVEWLLAVPADVLRAGVVLSPEFMARNFARDTLSGFMQSKAGIMPVAGTVSGFKEIASRSDAARLYRAFGGAYGDLWRADRGLERKLVERMARQGGFDPRTIVTPRGLISLLHRMGSVAEAGTRVAEFKKSMGRGTVDELIDAAYNAREVSVDFGMHGHSRSVRFLTRITPFLNPALQGWYKAIRTGGSAPLATLTRGGMLTAASLWLYFENQDKEWYQRLENWERNVYWHVDVGLRDKIGQAIPLRIPKPFEWGAVFGSVPEALAEVAIEQNGKDFGKRLSSIVDDVMLPRVIPTALLVPHELAANRSQFTGRPIVPESKQRLAPELQSTAGTSATAQKLGELTGTAPAKIDHAVRGFFGTLGTYTFMLTDQAMRPDGTVRAHRDFPWQRAPVARVFFHDPSGASSRQVTEFYEMLKDAREADASLRQMGEESALEYYRKHQATIEARRGAEKVARSMADLRRETERLRRDTDLPAEERQRMILENNRQIRWLARDFMREPRLERRN